MLNRRAWWRLLAVLGLLALGHGLQLYFFAHFPQPRLFGDPAGYYKVGERLQEAVARLLAGEARGAVFEQVRGALPLIGVGSLFAVMDGLRPRDWAFFQVILASFNTAGMLGTFLLGRRLSGSFAGGLLALATTAVYSSHAVQTGRLYPDPLTGCLFVWAVVLYVEALHRDRPRLLAAAGFVLGLGLLVRAQLMTYFLLLAVVGLAGTARRWARRARSRRWVLAFLLGWLPWAAVWGGVVWAAGERDDVVQLGNATFKPLYPYGFWQFLETDGWIGPYRFKQEPYYQAMEAEARANQDPDLLRSRARQLAFTARYVAERPLASVLLVLDNAYRLYDRPANDYKWDYPFSYPWQVGVQRGILLLALLGLVLLVAERRGHLAVFLLPGSLALLHGLVFAWPRYNLPVMPILIAVAGATVPRLAEKARAAVRGRTWGWPASALLAGGLLLGLSRWLFMSAPELSRLGWVLGLLVLLGSPFLLCGRGGSLPRTLAGLVWTGLALLLTAHQARSPLWHQVETEVGGAVAGVEQEITLGPEALASLRSAGEAFLLFDLRVPRGDLSQALLQVGDTTLPGSRLLPTMPRLPESTSAGGRDWRGYPQWWALPLSAQLLPEDAARPLRVRLRRTGGPSLLLGGDRFRGQQVGYQGPGFGDWTKVVALKLEYDGDYRIPDQRPLGSRGTRSFLVQSDGQRTPVAFIHRIRLVTLADSQGGLHWETESAAAGKDPVFGFAAFSGGRGRAELRVADAVLDFPLGAREDFEVANGPFRLCHQAQGLRQDKALGVFLLSGPFQPGSPQSLEVRFKTGLSLERRFFVLDRRADVVSLTATARCSIAPDTRILNGAARVLDGARNHYPEDFGPWSISGVY
ncbi:MAG TPA: hypothetical protein VJU18_09490 [Vicinamibacteria bacterium]|nr:hypothetical protein [Vicinamibacteria bacterium]